MKIFEIGFYLFVIAVFLFGAALLGYIYQLTPHPNIVLASVTSSIYGALIAFKAVEVMQEMGED